MEKIFARCKLTTLHQVYCQQPSRFDPLINKQYFSLTPIKIVLYHILQYRNMQIYTDNIQELSSVWVPKEMKFFT